MSPLHAPIELVRAVDAAIGSASYRALTLLDRLAHATCPCHRCLAETERLARALAAEMLRLHGEADPTAP